MSARGPAPPGVEAQRLQELEKEVRELGGGGAIRRGASTFLPWRNVSAHRADPWPRQGPERGSSGRACQFFCVCGLEVGGDPVGVGGSELGEGLFPVGGELALDETGWGGAFAGGFALVLVAFAGALVAVAGLLATVV